MIVEILAVLIVFGAVLLVAIRYMMNRKQDKDNYELEQEYLSASTEKLKGELKSSADTIIKRLGSHVKQLENLLQEADNKRLTLEARMVDGERLAWELKNRIEELERRANDLKAAYALQEQRIEELKKINQSPRLNRASVQMGQPAPASVANSVQKPNNQLPATEFNTTAQRVDSDDFATVLHRSILRENTNRNVERTALARAGSPDSAAAIETSNAGGAAPISSAQSAAAQPEADADSRANREAADVQNNNGNASTMNESDTSKPDDAAQQTALAIKLLQKGHSAHQAARESGLSLAAIELVKQINKL